MTATRVRYRRAPGDSVATARGTPRSCRCRSRTSANDLRNPWTAEPWSARLEFDYRPDECLVRPFRSGLAGARSRREQPAVLAMHQRLMKRQKRRWTDGDREL